MDNNMEVSVCITAYKQKKYLRQCLDTIFSQVFTRNFEVIVCDDCSNDGTEEILIEYKNKYKDKFIYRINKKNLGLSKNIYQCRVLARGKYICGAEADDWWCDDYRIQKQYDFLESHPNCSAVACNYFHGSECGNVLRKKVMKNYEINK